MISKGIIAMKEAIKVSNITCANCAQTITQYFNDLDDIQANVHVTSKRVTFTYDEQKYQIDDLIHHLSIIGYHAIMTSDDAKKQRKKMRLILFLERYLHYHYYIQWCIILEYL